MKKIIFVILGVVLLFAMSGCGDGYTKKIESGFNQKMNINGIEYTVLGGNYVVPQIDSDFNNDTFIFRVMINNTTEENFLATKDVFTLLDESKNICPVVKINFNGIEDYVKKKTSKTVSIGFNVEAKSKQTYTLVLKKSDKEFFEIKVDFRSPQIGNYAPISEFNVGDEVAVRELFITVRDVTRVEGETSDSILIDIFVKNNATGAGVTLYDKFFNLFDLSYNKYFVSDRGTLPLEIDYTGDTEGVLTFTVAKKTKSFVFAISREPTRGEDLRGIKLIIE